MASAANSDVFVIVDNQLANGVDANVFKIYLRDSRGNAIGGATAIVSGTPTVRFNGGGVGAGGSCTSQSDGTCQVTATSTTAGGWYTPVQINNVTFRNSPAAYRFLPTTVPLALAVTWGNNWIAGDTFTVTATSPSNNPSITSTAGNSNTGSSLPIHVDNTVNLPAGTFSDARQTGSYTTTVRCTDYTSSGAVVLFDRAVPTSFVMSRSYTNLICNYTNTPLPSDASKSDVYVTTNDKPASGMARDSNVLKAYLRNVNGYLVGGATTTFDATGAVAFNGGTPGAAGSCVTNSVSTSPDFGTCQVTATSTARGPKSTNVRTGGNTLRNSPVAYNFIPFEPQVRIVKDVITSSGGTSFFNFTLSGLSVSTDSISVPGVGTRSNVAALDGTDGLAVTISERSPAGWPVNPVRASCVDTTTARSDNPSGPLGTLSGNTLMLPAAYVRNGSNFVCTFTNAFSFSVTGRVFTDNGIGGGTANDAAMNGGELGSRGAEIKLTNCAGGVISTSTADGNGAYSLIVPFSTNVGDPLCVEKTTPAPRMSTGPNSFNLAWNGTGHYNLNFGEVEPNTFVANGAKSAPAGSSVSYAHTFNAQTAGSVSFSVSAVASPAANGWNEKVFSDTRCTGSLQPDAVQLGTVATTAGQIVCVVMQEFIPLSVLAGHSNTATLHANFTFANSPMTATYTVTDVTTAGGGALDLVKEVRNVTTSGVFSLNNQAKSGETLEYRITYTNNSANAVSGLSVTDATPNHTTFVSASDDLTPAALTSCQKQTPANPAPAATVACSAPQPSGGTGPINLRYVGSVAPGAVGVMLFQVKVD